MVKERAFNMELFFAALADRTRLRLINLIGEDEICVCFFVEVIKTNQPKISRHLAYLRRAGIVEARREGKWMHYRVVEPKDPHFTLFRAFRQSKVRSIEWVSETGEAVHEFTVTENISRSGADDEEQVDFKEVLSGIKVCSGSDADIQERLERIDRWTDLLEGAQSGHRWGVENLLSLIFADCALFRRRIYEIEST